ncbi:hypothetical protein FQA47_003956 [Oryzias melastigma]|uniref:Uncharacterized protein n=1 Tax=Oryzias melastigma TaxID=30732 RepID=A0A834C0B5_ORYME|nr:hypothetical protein FQA47_003956 [Oryzias melastigma]
MRAGDFGLVGGLEEREREKCLHHLDLNRKEPHRSLRIPVQQNLMDLCSQLNRPSCRRLLIPDPPSFSSWGDKADGQYRSGAFGTRRESGVSEAGMQTVV